MDLPLEHPESLTLRAECERRRTLLASLLAELHQVREIGLPNARSLYASLFGALIVAALEAEIGYRREKKRLELIRASLAAGVVPDSDAIEERLACDLADWTESLEQAVADAVAGRRWTQGEHDYESARELRAAFRSLARRFHPDVLGDEGTEAHRRTWLLALSLYESRDLAGLQALVESETALPATLAESGLDTLRARARTLEMKVEAVGGELESLRAVVPLCHWRGMHDETWVAEHRGEIECRAQDYEDAKRRVEDDALRMLGFDPDGDPETEYDFGREEADADEWDVEKLDLGDLPGFGDGPKFGDGPR